MKSLSQRAVFTLVMTGLAMLLGSFAVYVRLGGQSDVMIDTIKITGVIGLGTAVSSFVFWTAARHRSDKIWRGGLAGMLTAGIIVPLPFFVYSLKTEILANLAAGTGVFASAMSALPIALKSGIVTFIDISKFSLIAALGSMAVGVLVARFVTGRSD